MVCRTYANVTLNKAKTYQMTYIKRLIRPNTKYTTPTTISEPVSGYITKLTSSFHTNFSWLQLLSLIQETTNLDRLSSKAIEIVQNYWRGYILTGIYNNQHNLWVQELKLPMPKTVLISTRCNSNCLPDLIQVLHN